jgi:hypothetical protein
MPLGDRNRAAALVETPAAKADRLGMQPPAHTRAIWPCASFAVGSPRCGPYMNGRVPKAIRRGSWGSMRQGSDEPAG